MHRMSALRAEDVEEGKGKGPPKIPCSGLRNELLDCLRGSDCVRIVSILINSLIPGNHLQNTNSSCLGKYIRPCIFP